MMLYKLVLFELRIRKSELKSEFLFSASKYLRKIPKTQTFCKQLCF
jgi:hypothetical protein